MGSPRWPYGKFATMSPDTVARWARGALNLAELCILDTETNGHGPPWDGKLAEIVELCIIDRSGSTLLNTLVRPRGNMHPAAAAKSGITENMLAGSAPCSALVDQVAQLLEGRAVVIFNAEFDYDLLQAEFKRCGQTLPTFEVRCAMLAYHAFCGRRGSEKWVGLARASAETGISIANAHRALGDCQATLALLQHMAAYAPDNRVK